MAKIKEPIDYSVDSLRKLLGGDTEKGTELVKTVAQELLKQKPVLASAKQVYAEQVAIRDDNEAAIRNLIKVVGLKLPLKFSNGEKLVTVHTSLEVTESELL